MTFQIITLGCKINSYESQAIRELFISKGFEEVENKESDYIIINTCAVTLQAEHKCTKTIHHYKKIYPSSKIIVCGCSSQVHKELFLSEKNVIAVYGNDKKSQIINNILSNSNQFNFVNERSRLFEFDDDLKISKFKGDTRATIKIQDGCDNFCSYCIVPYTRGKSRSRKKEDILFEFETLLKNNYKEIIISGIDVSSYHDPRDNNYNLTSLIKDLLKFTNYEYRIRISSIEISKIDDEYISLFKNEKLCPHFHIPLQSGSEKILKLMNRKYDLEYFKDTIKKIRKIIPDVAFSTDVITGFPGEDEKEFLETYNFLLDNKFMRIHAFPYSERPSTRALLLKEKKVDMSIRKKRVRTLIQLSNKLDKEYRKSLLNKKVKVLVDYKDNDNNYIGYSQNYLEMKIKSNKDIVGEFIDVDIDL